MRRAGQASSSSQRGSSVQYSKRGHGKDTAAVQRAQQAAAFCPGSWNESYLGTSGGSGVEQGEGIGVDIGVTSLDGQGVGRVLGALEDLGLANHTLGQY